MKTIGDLRARADQLLFQGDTAGAVQAYAAIVRLQPQNLDARLRVGDALLAAGEVQRAAVVYTSLARHASHAGYPLRALVALKILAALDPQLGTLLEGLAQLYSVGSPRLEGRAVRISPGEASARLPDAFELGTVTASPGLFEAAETVAADTSDIAAYPDSLPPIPLCSELPPDAFARVLEAVKLVRVRPEAVVIAEGTQGHSFFVLARGEVVVTRRSTDGETMRLASLHDGAIFGEMALVSALPRSATVVAVTDCDLLEFDRDALVAASRDIETLSRALDKFTRERLLNNLLAAAPLFKPLDRRQRLDLVRRFSAHDFVAGTPLIQEGEAGRGLYVVLNGQVDVSKVDGNEKVLLATLGPGEVFGEISLLHDQPTSASVTGASNGTVLFLAREYFQRLITAVDEIRAYVENLGDERLMDTQILLGAGPPVTDDEQIFI
jgi:CRP-like cAMP-binding protein